MTVIPRPAQFTPRPTSFTLTADTAIAAATGAEREAETLARALRPATGFALPVVALASATAPRIELHLAPGPARDDASGLLDEGYELEVFDDHVELRAATTAGLFYAGQTLRQLLPDAIFAPTPAPVAAWTVPGALVRDRPRFPWRGAHLDVARHFMPVEFIKRFIDLIAMHKLNVFHWHLTEDQGWRLEIKKYPRLTEVGAWRAETLAGHARERPWRYDGVPHGGFYSQNEVRDIVAYAAERHVRVVPEIEMPGHAQAAIASYPELGNTGEQLEVGRVWDVYTHVFNVSESTIRFLQDVLEEVMALFPSPFIHVGGDECPKVEWRESPAAQARLRELGLRDEDELQSFFIRRMDEFLTAHGRRLIGWDEIFEGGLAANATVMCWRGADGEKTGIQAARAGHDVIMARNAFTYFDYYQAEDTSREPLAIGGLVTLEKAYSYDPVPDELRGDPAARHILGSQGQLWTEYMPDPAHVEYMAFPRLTALAEVVWSPREHRDYADFLERLEPHLARLDRLRVNYRRPEALGGPGARQP